MARLPQPGSDDGTWGQILNDYLTQTLASDGTLKADIVTSTHLADNAVTTAQIAPGAVSSSELGNGTVTEAKLSTAVQTKLNATGGGAVSSVAGKTGAVTLVKADVGLANVDNTTDANKPVSSATQTALDQKAALNHTHTASDISDSTSAGRALLTATDTATQLTTLGVYSKSDTRSYSSTASSASSTPVGSALSNLYFLTAQAAAAVFNVPSGTAQDGNVLIIRVKDNGTSRAITWNGVYRAVGTTLPTTTLTGKTLYVAALYNAADTKWDVVDVRQEA